MQHTEALNLKLIEPDDTFSPDPLNENAQTLETALTAETDARSSADTALDTRILKLEGKRLVCGSYTGNGSTTTIGKQTINLGFTPKVVLIHPKGLSEGVIVTAAHPFLLGKDYVLAKIVENGFYLQHSSPTVNTLNTVYLYIAFN